MLLIILIIACILVLLAYLVVTVRRHDRNAYADREQAGTLGDDHPAHGADLGTECHPQTDFLAAL